MDNSYISNNSANKGFNAGDNTSVSDSFNDSHDKTTTIINNYGLSEKDKKRKKRIENVNRYGLKYIMDSGRGGTLIRAAALIRTFEYHNTKKGKMYVAINPHTLDGEFLSDHIHIDPEPIDRLLNKYNMKCSSLMYVIFTGRPYNYNNNRMDAYSIDITERNGGRVIIQPDQTILTDGYYIGDEYEVPVGEIAAWLSSEYIGTNEYIQIINFLNNIINRIVKDSITKDFIFNYIKYSYLLECSHKNMYLKSNNFDLANLDYDMLEDLVVLLGSVLYKLQRCEDIDVEMLFTHIGYNITAIQNIHNLKSYKTKKGEDLNFAFHQFEAKLGKTDTWELINHRKQNLKLTSYSLKDKQMVYIEGLTAMGWYKNNIINLLNKR